MRSGSFERGDQPRSVPDPDGEAYEKMIQTSRALADRRFGDAETGEVPDVGHPGPIESFIPLWGSGREALADLHDKNGVGAGVNTALFGLDAFGVGELGSGLLKGGLKLGGPFVWRNAPWEGESMRQWLGRKGFLAKGQPGHHWILEQSTKIPDAIKNQPLFIKGMKDAVQHGRVHGPYTVKGQKLPQYNALQRFWYGTPDWFKALNATIPGHLGTATGRAVADGSGAAQQQQAHAGR